MVRPIQWPLGVKWLKIGLILYIMSYPFTTDGLISVHSAVAQSRIELFSVVTASFAVRGF